MASPKSLASASSSPPTAGAFQDPFGNLAANGRITLDLPGTQALIGGGLVSQRRVVISLDANGKVAPNQSMYCSDQFVATNVSFTSQLFDVNNNFMGSLGNWVIQGAAPVDLATIVPTVTGVSYPNPLIVLQTNGTNNGNQNKLNIATGNGLTAVDGGTGTVTMNLANVAAVSHQFVTSVASNILVQAQPAFSDISGTIATGQIPSRTGSIDFVIDGGGNTPTTGAKGQISIPVAMTVAQWILTADQSGSAVIDVLRSTYSGFPTTSSIAGTDKPTLSSVQKNRNTGPLSNWGSTALVAGDELQLNLNSVTTCTRLNLTLVVSVPWA